MSGFFIVIIAAKARSRAAASLVAIHAELGGRRLRRCGIGKRHRGSLAPQETIGASFVSVPEFY
jgi:hypothetical protein